MLISFHIESKLSCLSPPCDKLERLYQVSGRGGVFVDDCHNIEIKKPTKIIAPPIHIRLRENGLIWLENHRILCLFNIDPDTIFFRISGTYNTLFRVNNFNEVTVSTIFSWSSVTNEDEYPIYSHSTLIGSKVMKRSRLKKTCQLAPMSIHYSFELGLTKFTSKTTTERIVSNSFWEITSITFASGSFLGTR